MALSTEESWFDLKQETRLRVKSCGCPEKTDDPCFLCEIPEDQKLPRIALNRGYPVLSKAKKSGS